MMSKTPTTTTTTTSLDDGVPHCDGFVRIVQHIGPMFQRGTGTVMTDHGLPYEFVGKHFLMVLHIETQRRRTDLLDGHFELEHLVPHGVQRTFQHRRHFTFHLPPLVLEVEFHVRKSPIMGSFLA